jgi:membrane dipeptidase
LAESFSLVNYCMIGLRCAAAGSREDLMYYELSAEEEAKVRRLHDNAIVLDGAFPMPGFYKAPDEEIGAFLEGGVTGGNATLSSDTTDFSGAVENFRKLKRLISQNDERMALCTRVADIEQCKRDGKMGMIPFFQNPKPIADRLGDVEIFYELGLRVFQMTYNDLGFIGAGCCERNDPGLSYFGIEVVKKCNEIGILLDISHCGPATSWDTLKFSKAPVVASHSSAYALAHAFGRNKPDDLMKAIADTGGLMGVAFFPCLVKREPDTHVVLPSTVEDVIDHVDHAVNIMGIDHVGIATDMSSHLARTLELTPDSVLRETRLRHPEVFGVGPTDRYDPYPEGLDSHAKMRNLSRGLLKRGYAEADIVKILGGNWMRVYSAVWKN